MYIQRLAVKGDGILCELFSCDYHFAWIIIPQKLENFFPWYFSHYLSNLQIIRHCCGGTKFCNSVFNQEVVTFTLVANSTQTKSPAHSWNRIHMIQFLQEAVSLMLHYQCSRLMFNIIIARSISSLISKQNPQYPTTTKLRPDIQPQRIEKKHSCSALYRIMKFITLSIASI